MVAPSIRFDEIAGSFHSSLFNLFYVLLIRCILSIIVSCSPYDGVFHLVRLARAYVIETSWPGGQN